MAGKAFPSFVAVNADGQLLVGEPARRQAMANPEGTATAFKRRMGRRDTVRFRDREFSPEQLEAAEMAKIELTTAITAHLSLPFLTAVAGEARHLELDLTRAELERVVAPIIERCRGPVEQAMRDAGVQPSNIDRIVFVGGPTRMPSVRTFFESLFGRRAESGIDPMECVACGAAIQAGVLAGQLGEIVLVDVTPLTLGVETLGGEATPLIARNTPIPVKHTEIFTTAADMQTSVTIHVFQGERAMAADNTSLGQFNLDGLPLAPRGIPKIEVTFDLDTSGILNAAALDTRPVSPSRSGSRVDPPLGSRETAHGR